MKINKYILCFLLLLVIDKVNSQSNYLDYENKKVEIFHEDFNNNNNNWSTGDSDDGVKGFFVDGGYYHWESTTSSTKTTSKKIPIDVSKDFEIEGKFKRVSGSETALLQSLIFGGNESKRYYFGFTADGSYRISYFNGSSYKAIKDWTKSFLINKYDWNVMTVRKVGKSIHFFINKKRVYTANFRSFFWRIHWFSIS